MDQLTDDDAFRDADQFRDTENEFRDNQFRDAADESRKGRKPIGDRPMTAAERQQRRRERDKEEANAASTPHLDEAAPEPERSEPWSCRDIPDDVDKFVIPRREETIIYAEAGELVICQHLWPWDDVMIRIRAAEVPDFVDAIVELGRRAKAERDD